MNGDHFAPLIGRPPVLERVAPGHLAIPRAPIGRAKNTPQHARSGLPDWLVAVALAGVVYLFLRER